MPREPTPSPPGEPELARELREGRCARSADFPKREGGRSTPGGGEVRAPGSWTGQEVRGKHHEAEGAEKHCGGSEAARPADLDWRAGSLDFISSAVESQKILGEGRSGRTNQMCV